MRIGSLILAVIGIVFLLFSVTLTPVTGSDVMAVGCNIVPLMLGVAILILAFRWRM